MEHIERMLALASKNDWAVGMAWYPAARLDCEQLAAQFKADTKRVVWAVAALSPQLKWERNIASAKAVLQGKTRFPGVYTANVEKAYHIVYDEDDWERWLSGMKVSNFARNMWGDTEAVTVDTWAWRIWAGVDLYAKPPNLDKLYERISADYRATARKHGLEARQMQAITWVTARRIATGKSTWGQLSLGI